MVANNKLIADEPDTFEVRNIDAALALHPRGDRAQCTCLSARLVSKHF